MKFEEYWWQFNQCHGFDGFNLTRYDFDERDIAFLEDEGVIDDK